MLEFIAQPWHWSISGFLIAMVMFALLYSGKTFGFSSNFRTLCAIAGAGKKVAFFRYDWKAQRWNLLFAVGAILGGFIATTWLASPEPVQISADTQAYLSTMGINSPGEGTQGVGFVPNELFDLGRFDVARLAIMMTGGFLIGFGTRWAGGCTSGHAISGLSNLQLPSLIAVIGFFVGGLLMTWLILPLLLNATV